MLTTIADIDFEELLNKEFYPSPSAWEDEVLYFLMLDRFSDGKENQYVDNDGAMINDGVTPLFSLADYGNATINPEERQKWIDAGTEFVGGTLEGLESKIGYLQRLGITAIWISPIFKQVPFQQTYHGYGIQNFLDVDPRFGTQQDLISLVQTAHKYKIRVILDIILNHSADVFEYREEDLRCEVKNESGETIFKTACWQEDGFVYGVKGWRNQLGDATIPFGPTVPTSSFPDEAIWPAEFQLEDAFTRRGEIRNWDNPPEFVEGDFLSLKNINLGEGPVDTYRPSSALMNLCEVYKYWIALADIDGFRVDTVKHMDLGASRLFTSAIHEFTETIGKENFYLIGEITGGRQNAVDTLEKVGMNAALGINEIPDKLEYLVKGYRNPEDYFNLFRNSILVKKNSHIWFGNHVVTTFDDHDQVRKGRNKARFCHNEPGQIENHRVMFNALAFNATTMGIPCYYYGSEQCFDGHGDNDRYIREAMFGGEFGAFESNNRHFFNENSFVYRELSKVLRIRNDSIVIRRGRQFLREISGDGIHFGLPHMIGGQIRSVVPWSRIHNRKEVLLAINTDYFNPRRAWITIDHGLHQLSESLQCIYSTDNLQINTTVSIEARNGKSVQITVPAAGFVIYQ